MAFEWLYGPRLKAMVDKIHGMGIYVRRYLNDCLGRPGAFKRP